MAESTGLNTTEANLLLRSHPEDRTNELLKDRYSLSGSQKPILLLGGTSGNITKNADKSNKPRKSKQRKMQGLNARTAVREFVSNALKNQRLLKKGGLSESESARITQEIPRYGNYVVMNKLWNSYISDLLFGHLKDNAPATEWPENLNPIILTSKLSTADFHGALLSVVSSRNPSTVGIQGVVIWESKNSFVVVVKDSPSLKPRGIRVIEKRGTVFQFTVLYGDNDEVGHNFQIIGSRFMYRTADRSGRKFKTHNVDDL
jgi:ribonuclease P protein subunit POP4